MEDEGRAYINEGFLRGGFLGVCRFAGEEGRVHRLYIYVCVSLLSLRAI